VRERLRAGESVASIRELSDFTLRRASVADLPALGRLGASLVTAHHAFDRERFIMPAGGDLSGGYAAFLAGELERDGVVILVAELAGAVVGYVYAGIEPHSWKELRDVAGFIHDVAVDEPARGRGIATALLEAAARALEERGAPRVMLWSAERNSAAQRLFERLGFRRTMVEMTREARR
jgi:ribosomal protein S18 acetylase RimI-like enzyme